MVAPLFLFLADVFLVVDLKHQGRFNYGVDNILSVLEKCLRPFDVEVSHYLVSNYALVSPVDFFTFLG